MLPNGEDLQATAVGYIPINNQLSLQAQQTYIFPELTNSSLLSIGQLCDNGCQALFDTNKLYIIKNNKVILQGYRNYRDGLWDIRFTAKIPQTSTKSFVANAIVRKDKSESDLANFYHASLFSPTIVTLQTAVAKNHFATWPGLNKLNFKKFITDKTNIDLGHLTQERTNLQSTKHLAPPIGNDIFPTPENPNIKTHNIMSMVVPFSAKELSYGDITGSFPFLSSQVEVISISTSYMITIQIIS